MTSSRPGFKVGDLVVLSSRWSGKAVSWSGRTFEEKVGDVAVVERIDDRWIRDGLPTVIQVTFIRTGTTGWWAVDDLDPLT